uniref:Uncharacterized protein n=1 Tax=Rhizophora mucronata TaxID=61149 RepID=A0A2P2LIU0_RHIMU
MLNVIVYILVERKDKMKKMQAYIGCTHVSAVCHHWLINPALIWDTILYLFKIYFHLCEILFLPDIFHCRTIPFAWNLITAGYIEQSIYGVWKYL